MYVAGVHVTVSQIPNQEGSVRHVRYKVFENPFVIVPLSLSVVMQESLAGVSTTALFAMMIRTTRQK